MIVDLDHLPADPICDAGRCGIDLHPLHSPPATAASVLLTAIAPIRLVGPGLLVPVDLNGFDCLWMRLSISWKSSFFPAGLHCRRPTLESHSHSCGKNERSVCSRLTIGGRVSIFPYFPRSVFDPIMKITAKSPPETGN